MTPDIEKIYTWEIDALSLFTRYLVFAGLSYFIFYKWKAGAFQKLKIQKELPPKKTISNELVYSFSTILIHCAASWMAFYCWQHGYTKIYLYIDEYGWVYFVFSVLLMVLVHDAYFYWTHRLMHRPEIFKMVHETHHQSTNPTPWAAFSFHPIEALISTGVIPVFIFIFPVHPVAIFSFITWMTLINVMGHLGYETFPMSFRKSSLGKWHNTSTNHNYHHRNSQYNFGLYFTFWDKLMNTYKPTTD